MRLYENDWQIQYTSPVTGGRTDIEVNISVSIPFDDEYPKFETLDLVVQGTDQYLLVENLSI